MAYGNGVHAGCNEVDGMVIEEYGEGMYTERIRYTPNEYRLPLSTPTPPTPVSAIATVFRVDLTESRTGAFISFTNTEDSHLRSFCRYLGTLKNILKEFFYTDQLRLQSRHHVATAYSHRQIALFLSSRLARARS